MSCPGHVEAPINPRQWSKHKNMIFPNSFAQAKLLSATKSFFLYSTFVGVVLSLQRLIELVPGPGHFVGLRTEVLQDTAGIPCAEERGQKGSP